VPPLLSGGLNRSLPQGYPQQIYAASRPRQFAGAESRAILVSAAALAIVIKSASLRHELLGAGTV
jgi:hypothetical protein